jgi:outer membrane protein assembly factor BamB
MISPEPLWSYRAENDFNQWYGRVRVWEDCVLGEWVCLDVKTGALRWEQSFPRPNTIVDIADGVIVASETRSDGPWTVDLGCYGISVQTGELLWVSHANGWYGKFLSLLDAVPLFTNDLRDEPLMIVDGDVLTRNGRLLDIHTGLCKRRDKELARRISKRALGQDDDHRFYYAKALTLECAEGTISTCPPGKTLEPGHIPGSLHGHYDIGFYRYSDSGKLLWSQKVSDLGYYSHGNFYSYRLRDPFIYCVVSEDKIVIPIDPKQPLIVERNPGHYRMVVLNADSGRVVQDIPLAEHKVTEARIENISKHGVLVSLENRELKMFARLDEKAI